jgi:DNA-binding protein HU-beta
MTEANLIQAVTFETGLPQVTVRTVLKAVGIQVAAVLARGDVAVLPELGKLKPVTRAARQGRNPKTGEPVAIPAKRTAKFSPSNALLERLEV